MPILQSEIRRYADTTLARKSRTLFEDARRGRKQTAFLSHSHKDGILAKGLQGFLREQGWDIYIDWQDLEMPSKPNSTTAAKIQRRIVELDWFLLLATKNSRASRWCPWELGYADGEKPKERLLIVPTEDDQGTTYGNEYFDLYRRVSLSKHGAYRVYEAGSRTSSKLLNEMRRM